MSQPILNPGGNASKPDYRSNIIAQAVAATNPSKPLPDALSTDFRRFGGLWNQLLEPACVSHVVARLMQLWWFLKTGQTVQFSARYLHIRSGLVQGSGPNDGRDPMTVMKVAKQYGCATIATCPNDTTLTPTQYLNMAITPAMDAEAAGFKIPGYVQVPVSQYGIREGISLYGAVGILMKISNAFWTDIHGNPTYAQSAIDPVRPPKNLQDVVSGHEVIGNQFNDTLDHFVNEWGTGWADMGESDYIWSEWQPWVQEVIAIAEIPSSALALVQGLPPAHEFKYQFAAQLAYGSSGPDVRALQIALSIDGTYTYPDITGFYGQATMQSVLAFQMKYQVAPVDVLAALNGRNVGPATIKKLNQLFNK